MQFTDQKPRIATEEECNAEWGRYKSGNGFKCYLCGHKFEIGDGWRWVYGGQRTINFMVCRGCDGDDVNQRFIEANEELRRRFWWSLREE